MGVESMPGFDALTDHDKVELVKFEYYLRVKRKPEQPVEGAYAHVYGEVVYEDGHDAKRCTSCGYDTTAVTGPPEAPACINCGVRVSK